MFYALSVVVGIVALSTWIYLLFGRGDFWRIRHFLLPRIAGTGALVRVAVIVPARNEAATIAASLSSLLQQCGSHNIHIYVVDDGSTDLTAQIARGTALQQGKADAVTIISGASLPPGWSGKVWAMQQGVERARELAPHFLLLTDADVVHGPDNLANLVALAESQQFDMVSLMVKLYCRCVAEKLFIPAFLFFFFKLYPPAWILDPRRPTAGAAGGCILIRPKALARADGLESIRGEIIDDCALAKVVKRNGGKVWLGVTTSTASVRPYGGAGEIGRMIARTAFNQLQHSALILIAAAAGMALTYLAPVALLFAGYTLPIVLGAAAWALMMIAFVPTVSFYGLNPLWALALPLAAIFYLGATLNSAFNFWAGRGGEWKGRSQDTRVASRSRSAL